MVDNVFRQGYHKYHNMEIGRRSLNNLKPIIGIALILFAVSGLVYWETTGRERMLTDTVLVAAETIRQGTLVSGSHFTELKVDKNKKIEGGIGPDDLGTVLGMTAKQTIVKNGQVSLTYFREDDIALKNGQSVFVIPSDWIRMRSSTLRRGDMVGLYDSDTMIPIGTYRVAFVKDSNEIEVRNTDSRESSPILERLDATAVISHIEIITDVDGYRKIADHLRNEPQSRLLIVQQKESES
ncbi:MAG: hypothetical protein CVU86_02585 [Firmicutes bacterium HGW-Firmicutes-11]|nr:MAG: hypothetical protein CVU86_02585 [Firmicutes bacterium HGW-Firmicutes-11]